MKGYLRFKVYIYISYINEGLIVLSLISIFVKKLLLLVNNCIKQSYTYIYKQIFKS